MCNTVPLMFVEHGTVPPPLPDLPRMYQSVQRCESSLDLALTDRDNLTIGYECLKITWEGPLETNKGLEGGLRLSARGPDTGCPLRASTRGPWSGA
jgi:hypothetical protein